MLHVKETYHPQKNKDHPIQSHVVSRLFKTYQFLCQVVLQTLKSEQTKTDKNIFIKKTTFIIQTVPILHNVLPGVATCFTADA